MSDYWNTGGTHSALSTEGTLSTEDREALVVALDAQIYGFVVVRPKHAQECLGNCAEHGCPVQVQDWGTPDDLRDIAQGLLASDWLAAHDRAIRAEAAEQALRDAAEDEPYSAHPTRAWLRARADAIAQGGEERHDD